MGHSQRGHTWAEVARLDDGTTLSHETIASTPNNVNDVNGQTRYSDSAKHSKPIGCHPELISTTGGIHFDLRWCQPVRIRYYKID